MTAFDELLQSANYETWKTRDCEENLVLRLGQYFPKIPGQLVRVLHEEDVFIKLQRMVELHRELARRGGRKEEKPGTKKVTRAALARRHEKNQEQIRKDQIFVRLTPKSQSTISFMLCNRNFPRIECKLSCNQHLQYLVTYLTNKWIRGKIGYKVVLYGDMNSFLKTAPLSEKDKAVKEPLNNYYMFTDIMASSNIAQNGILSLSYDIVETRVKNDRVKTEERDNVKSQEEVRIVEMGKPMEPQRSYPLLGYPNCDSNRNSNFYIPNEESLFGQLSYNYGANQIQKSTFISVNSINYEQPRGDWEEPKEEAKGESKGGPKEESKDESKEEGSAIRDGLREGHKDDRLGSLLNAISLVQKEKDNEGFCKFEEDPEEKSNLVQVKTISITKKKTIEK